MRLSIAPIVGPYTNLKRRPTEPITPASQKGWPTNLTPSIGGALILRIGIVCVTFICTGTSKHVAYRCTFQRAPLSCFRILFNNICCYGPHHVDVIYSDRHCLMLWRPPLSLWKFSWRAWLLSSAVRNRNVSLAALGSDRFHHEATCAWGRLHCRVEYGFRAQDCQKDFRARLSTRWANWWGHSLKVCSHAPMVSPTKCWVVRQGKGYTGDFVGFSN